MENYTHSQKRKLLLRVYVIASGCERGEKLILGLSLETEELLAIAEEKSEADNED